MKKYSLFLALSFVLIWSAESIAQFQWQVLSPIAFTRSVGEPATETFTFSALGGTASVRLVNGDLEDSSVKRVSSSTVSLNGQIIFASSNFNQNVASLEQEITLRNGQNNLEVTLRGKPGGQVTIQITQAIATITPEVSLAQTANALRVGDIDLVLEGFLPIEKSQRIIPTLDAAQRNQLAYWIENAELIKESDNRRVYRYTWPDIPGENYSDFSMIKTEVGKWMISNW